MSDLRSKHLGLGEVCSGPVSYAVDVTIEATASGGYVIHLLGENEDGELTVELEPVECTDAATTIAQLAGYGLDDLDIDDLP